MHSLIISVVRSKGLRAVGIESLYAGEQPIYADYTTELDHGELMNVADAMCDIFPFCTKDEKNALRLHIDHEAAHKALLDRYAQARDLLDRLAHGEKPTGIGYEASVLVSGDRYGVHVVVDNYRDLNDLEFIQYCAGESFMKSPDTLYIKRAWDYHC
jgi:hypothetical protein